VQGHEDERRRGPLTSLGEGGPVRTGGGSAPRRNDATVDHEGIRADGSGEDPDGGDHGASAPEWRPTYQHEVAVRARLRHVSCPSGCEETPAVVLRVDNADNAGEIAMTAGDLSSVIDHLLGLRGALAPAGETRPDGAASDGDGR
jgi:hypothetical protein